LKLGVFNPIFYDKSLEAALDTVKNLGLDAVEIGCGNYPGDRHCDPKKLLSDGAALGEFKSQIENHGLMISALSCHGNPLHPSASVAEKHRKVQRDTILLAGKLGVERIVTFSGCPGDSEDSKYPNWVTSAWPEDYPRVLEWQWREKVIPYWQKEAEFAEKNGVGKICIELHPGFVVYNTETMLKLRDAAGKTLGANFDPSHMFWQGIDPCQAILKLGGECIYHFHAKDTHISQENTIINGVLDTKSYADLRNRSWYFRTVGYGHDLLAWKNIVSTLRLVGYDYVVSIEHEDALLSRNEGLKKAVGFLKQVLIAEPPAEAWWT
jgi:sugar phosphate isomerase/epimerase